MVRRVLVAGLIAGVVIACADPAKHVAAGAMAGVGGAMIDAGDMLSDGAVGGRSDAAAGVGGIGGMLADAGGALVDAGAALDGSSTLPDADAQEPREPTILEAPCNIESGRLLTTPMTAPMYRSESITFYAEFEVGARDITDLAGASVISCDRESLDASPAADPCDGDTIECEDIGVVPWPQDECTASSFVGLMGSKVRVGCGYRYETRTNAGVSSVTGYRWNSVRLVIP